MLTTLLYFLFYLEHSTQMQTLSKNTFVFLASMLLFSSCYNNKRLVYFQDTCFSGIPKLMVSTKSICRLQPNDILISFKVTVLGEVNNPGYHYVCNNQIAILEAFGLATDLNPVGSEKNVKLIRQVPDGSEIVLLDLMDPRLLKSKHLYLMPNDALYVEPLPARSSRLNLEPGALDFANFQWQLQLFNS